MAEEAKRFNKGKLRYDLIPDSLNYGVAQVLGFGAEKYGDNNWQKGMKWSKVIASLKRHLAALERGEDYDEESLLLHIDHINTNGAFLKQYYKTHLEMDDRPHSWLNEKKIGLDIDEVLCNWTEPWNKKFGYPPSTNWNFSYNNLEHFQSFSGEELSEFYLNLPRLIEPKDLPFEPHAYITSRSIPIEITKQWLQQNGFPTVSVYSVGFGKSKVDIAKESGIDLFVDDCYKNFVELNNAGICTFLYDAPWNRKYNVGIRRIKSLKELI